ncbi:hypothetical protein D9619_013262 [Psilocybe cf. subviscida]|uniref:Uncharacterized protein n=1 Tax=Psilocybe cf. subviscida TaxID=2480587 RepID=A0A8H5F957_9AGAR|nr:hypothetical protein D9619_013262 [Psilocybe cf. subviscida]
MLAVLIFILLHSNAVMPAPILSLVSATSTCCIDVTQCHSAWYPRDGVLPTRQWYTIGQSCLVTIIACVWTSAHPNVNGPMDSGWTCTKRRVVTMFCALFAPEVVLYWAVQQLSTAHEIVSAYNREFASQYLMEDEKPQSLSTKFKAIFHTVPKEATRRGSGHPWTVAHGFFVQMGGFLLYDKGYPTAVLDYRRLGHLLRTRSIDPPAVTEAELEDRSKGNAISKSIVVLQTSWFVLQCCARWNKNLPVSELEAMTLAFAVLNGATYAVWWSKPQGVGVPICLHLKESEDVVNPVPRPPSSIISQTTTITGTANSTVEKHISLFTTHQGPVTIESYRVRQDAHRNPDNLNASELILLPTRLVTLILRPVLKMLHAEGNHVHDSAVRIPMFYASPTETGWGGLVSVLVGSTYGGLHLLALMTNFTSNVQSVLWLVCSTIMTVTPIAVFVNIKIGDIIDGMKEESPSRRLRVGKFILKLEYTLLVLFYVAARFSIMALAFWGIKRPPPGVLLDLTWTSYIPHL